jgi:hypothetical protein
MLRHLPKRLNRWRFRANFPACYALTQRLRTQPDRLAEVTGTAGGTTMSPSKILAAAVLGAGVIGLSTLNASADVACSGNVCWHVHERYEYPPSANITIHEDAWKPGPGISFREHTGRGYWSGDRWTEW